MPVKPKKKCNYLGCRRLTKGKYCKEHEHLDMNTKFRNKKGTTHKWYYSEFWRKLRILKLTENPLCEYCDTITPANTVDHMIDWKTGKTEEEKWRLFSDYDNLRSSCTSCHNRKTGKTNK